MISSLDYNDRLLMVTLTGMTTEPATTEAFTDTVRRAALLSHVEVTIGEPSEPPAVDERVCAPIQVR